MTGAAAGGQRLRFFDHRGRRVACAVTGGGPPLLCDLARLHHLDVFWRRPRYRRLIEALSRRFTVVRFDRPGCGLSDRSEADFTLAAELTLFDHLADELRLDRPAILASASSVPVAIAIATFRPARVSRLALFGSRFAPLPAEAVHLGALDLLLRTRFDLATEIIARRVAAGCDDAAIQWLAAAYPQVAPAGVIARWLHEAATRDVRPLLTHVRCPTLLMHRRGDTLVDLRQAVDAAARMRDAVLLPLDGTESIIWEGDVDALVGPLQRFLSEPLAGDLTSRLTPREREVALLVADGLTNEQIAARLRIGRRTVESRLERARSKLGLQSRAALAAWAARTRIS